MRSVIYDVASPTRSRDTVIDLFRVQICLLAVQNEVVPFDPEIRCYLLAKQDKGENIAILLNLQNQSLLSCWV